MRRLLAVALAAALVLAGCTKPQEPQVVSSGPAKPPAPLTVEQARAIAKEAYVYGYPMVDAYRVMYSYFVDSGDPEYKGPWNEVHSTARVFTPQDTAIQTPNSDTPYSALGADLRTEPLVLTVPPVERDRYYSLQFIDLYTYNVSYVGSRTTGNGGGRYLLAGPSWKGSKPDGIDGVIQSDTSLAMVLYRTQLFGPDDVDAVKKIQAGYQVTPLSTYLNQPAPPPAPPIDFAPPLSRDQERTSLQVFDLLGFLLRFAPTVPAEAELRGRFATLGIGPDRAFDPEKLSPEIRAAVEAGVADAWAELDALKKNEMDTGKVGSAQFFGTAADLKGNYSYRMAGAVFGIFGNTAAEALYPGFFNDAAGAPLTGADRYTVTFAPGQLPPVNAFWSLTMYDQPQSLLVANPINRYLINSAMVPALAKNPDGGYTLYVQHDPPDPARLDNWLPAPSGPFGLVMRLYWPKPDALNGSWKAPAPVKV